MYMPLPGQSWPTVLYTVYGLTTLTSLGFVWGDEYHYKYVHPVLLLTLSKDVVNIVVATPGSTASACEYLL